MSRRSQASFAVVAAPAVTGSSHTGVARTAVSAFGAPIVIRTAAERSAVCWRCYVDKSPVRAVGVHRRMRPSRQFVCTASAAPLPGGPTPNERRRRPSFRMPPIVAQRARALEAIEAVLKQLGRSVLRALRQRLLDLLRRPTRRPLLAVVDSSSGGGTTAAAHAEAAAEEEEVEAEVGRASEFVASDVPSIDVALTVGEVVQMLHQTHEASCDVLPRCHLERLYVTADHETAVEIVEKPAAREEREAGEGARSPASPASPGSPADAKELVGFIYLDDLLLNPPSTPVRQILHRNELVINVHEKRQQFVRNILKMGLPNAPVVDDFGRFVGIVTASDVATIVDEDAADDVLRMSGVAVSSPSAAVRSYFETPFHEMIKQRLPWLGGLLVLQSVSSFILAGYEDLISKHLAIALFLTMLIGTGGNSGNQSSALVVRGLATGEMEGVRPALRVLWREFRLSLVMATLLGSISFCRVAATPHASFMDAVAISISVSLVVISAMTLGTALPLLLNRLNFDPAHSAAPFLSTLVDIAGVLITCAVCSCVLGR
eukprot:tig00000989_g6120.t1